MPLKTVNREHATPRKGRGAGINPEGRFENTVRDVFDDGWFHDEIHPSVKTHVTAEYAKSIINRNDSPDIPFSQSINPYRGCEHGCIYCYARPSHAYVDLSPGVDFETRLFAKVNAPLLLRNELARSGYRCEPIALGMNTDAYQPIERDYKITRGLLQVLAECDHPVSLVTKSALIERDLDILRRMAQKNLVHVSISVNNLDHEIARRMEPRAAAPARRMETIRRLSEAGIPTGVIVAPVIPFLTDDQIENVLAHAHDAGARNAGYVLMRLPYEVKDLFRDWLKTFYPLKAQHVMSRVHQMRDGRDNDPNFGSRMRGSGEFATLLRKRFEIARARCGFKESRHELDVHLFRSPSQSGQGRLF